MSVGAMSSPLHRSVAAEQEEIAALNSAYELLLRESPALALGVFRHTTTSGMPLDFVHRGWMIDILRDRSEVMAIMKAVQIGVSECAILMMFEDAIRKRPVMYVLPREGDVNDFVPARINALANNSPFYSASLSPDNPKLPDKNKQKTIFGTTCYFVGSNSASNFAMRSVDTLMIDEVDKCDADNLLLAPGRLKASASPRLIEFSNPSVEGHGISVSYSKTDRKEWLVTCSHCGEHQPLDWWINVVRRIGERDYELRCPNPSGTDALCVCRKCERPLDRLSAGQWVKQDQSATASGYHCNAIFGSGPEQPVIRRLFAEYVTALPNPGKLQVFYNESLGITYDAEGTSVSPQMLAACVSEWPENVDGTIVAGVDVGALLHLHIGQIHCFDFEGWKRRKLFAGTVANFEELERMVDKFNVSRGVIDAMPDKFKVEEFIRNRRSWFRCYFTGEGVPKFGKDQIVSVDRTFILDGSKEEYEMKRVSLPSDYLHFDRGQFVKQMDAPKRVLDSSRKPPKYIWTEGSLPDHHRLADTYEYLAALRAGYLRGTMQIVSLT